MTLCSACGAHLIEGAKFCMDCGATVSPDGAGSPVVVTPPPVAPVVRSQVMIAPVGTPTTAELKDPWLGIPTLTLARTIFITGFMLIFLFFSPFVSCGNRTFTGMQAFEASLPSNNFRGEPLDGILLIIFPLVGSVGAGIGAIVMQQLQAGKSPRQLQSYTISGLIMGMLGLCPIAVGINQLQDSGAVQLLWGFWLSATLTLVLISAAVLLTITPDPPPLRQPEQTPHDGAT
jgi:hypothetical protein